MDKRLHLLPSLRFFETAARLESYSAAAIELGVTQAAVSQQIRSLESALGVKLFYRHHRAMRLTSVGNTLHQHVRHGFDQILSGFNRIQSEPLEGTVTVSTTPSFASRWLMPRLWRFSSLHPMVSIRVLTDKALAELKHSDIDVAIRQGVIEEQDPQLEYQLLFEEPVYPMCSPELAKSIKFTHPEKILKCWLIHGEAARDFSWERWFKRAGVHIEEKPAQWMEVSTFELGLSAVMAGHGVCLATDSLAGDLIERGLLVKPFNIGISPGVRYSVIHNSISPRIGRINLFKTWLNDEVAVMKAHSNIARFWSDFRHHQHCK